MDSPIDKHMAIRLLSELARWQDRPVYQNLGLGVALSWTKTELATWFENAQSAFAGCTQLSISFDPSDYTGEETNVAVAYRWDENLSTIAPISVPWLTCAHHHS